MLPQNYILPPKTDEWTADTLRIRFKLFKLHLFAFFPTISFPVAEFPKSSPGIVWQKTSEPQLECCECSQAAADRKYGSQASTGSRSSSPAPWQRCRIRWTLLLGDGNFAVIICRQRNTLLLFLKLLLSCMIYLLYFFSLPLSLESRNITAKNF